MTEVIIENLNATELIQKLLNEAANITDKHNKIAQATGRRFNMFELTNVAENEVRMCRVLTDLLNPNGTHCQGRIYLDLFFKEVLKLPLPCEPISVEREFVIDENRRIDILIKDSTRIIPIEVKINAGDQPNQLYDYSQRSKGTEKPKVYYLTKFGTEPSENSCYSSSKNEKLEKEGIGCISWSHDILKWLDACISHDNTSKRAPIREILIQFAAVIRKFTEQLEEDEKMEIEELLLKTPENLKSATDIAIALDNVKMNLLENFRLKLEANLTGKIRKPDESNGNRNSWNIGYKLDNANENIRVIRISYENKAVLKLIQILSEDWNTHYKTEEAEKVFSLSDNSFYELVKEEQLDSIVQDCINWITDKLNKQFT